MRRKLTLAAVAAAMMVLVAAGVAQARTATVYAGSYDRVGKLDGSGSTWTVYEAATAGPGR